MISQEPDGASAEAACQCQNKPYCSSRRGPWLLAAPRDPGQLQTSAPTPAEAGTACSHSPSCSSGIQFPCTRTSFTLAACAWRLGQQGNQGSREKLPSVMENRTLLKIQLQSNPALEAEVLTWMVNVRMNSSSLPRFTAGKSSKQSSLQHLCGYTVPFFISSTCR